MPFSSVLFFSYAFFIYCTVLFNDPQTSLKRCMPNEVFCFCWTQLSKCSSIHHTWYILNISVATIIFQCFHLCSSLSCLASSITENIHWISIGEGETRRFGGGSREDCMLKRVCRKLTGPDINRLLAATRGCNPKLVARISPGRVFWKLF